MNLTEVILEDGKVLHKQEEITLEAFRMPGAKCYILAAGPYDHDRGNSLCQMSDGGANPYFAGLRPRGGYEADRQGAKRGA